jgi:hypothetical protein
VVAACAAALSVTTTAVVASPGATAGTTAKTGIFYVISAHPDDFVPTYAFLEQMIPSSAYVVNLAVTQGDGTDSCKKATEARNHPAGGIVPGTVQTAVPPTAWLANTGLVDIGPGSVQAIAGDQLWALSPGTEVPVAAPRVFDHEDSNGPFKYEGPDSPVSEPDEGERHPYGFPWVGQNTTACADANIASMHWMLDDMHGLDGTGTDMEVTGDPRADDDYVGLKCPPGQRGQGSADRTHCADVWANDEGARVVFHLVDSPYLDGYSPSAFDRQDVDDVIAFARANRRAWGMPDLPELGAFTPAGYCEREVRGTLVKDNPDHQLVSDAVRYGSLQPNWGIATCESEYYEGAERITLTQDPDTLLKMNWIDPQTNRRVGPTVVDYGWLVPEYYYDGCYPAIAPCDFWHVPAPPPNPSPLDVVLGLVGG